MSNKTVIILMTVAIGLLAFITFFERNTMTTGERLSRKNRVFEKYVREAVDQITIAVHTQSPTVLNGRLDPTGLERHWTIQRPSGTLKADEVAVQELLSAMDFVIKDRTVSAGIDEKRFGLINPRLSATVKVRGESIGIKVGADAGSDKVYLSIDGEKNTVYVVENDFYNTMNKTLNQLREKKLLTKSLGNATSLTVIRDTETIRLKKKSSTDFWTIQNKDTWVMANQDQVSELLRSISDLSAAAFISDGASEDKLGQYGLKTTKRKVTAEVDGQTVTVLMGAACTKETNETPSVYASVQGSGTVVCLEETALEGMGKPAARLYEMRLAPVALGLVERVELQKGDDKLVFVRNEETRDWLIDGEHHEMPIEQQAVLDMLSTVMETQGTRLTVDHPDAVNDSEPSGQLGSPTAQVKLILETGGPVVGFELFETDAVNLSTQPIEAKLENESGVDAGTAEEQAVAMVQKPSRYKIKRLNETVIIDVPAEVNQVIDPMPIRYKKRTIKIADEQQISTLHIVGPTAQTLKKTDDKWRVTSPVTLPADQHAAKGLARLFSDLTVERYISTEALSSHGFNSPFATVTAQVGDNHIKSETASDASATDHIHQGQNGKQVTLEIGNLADENTRYARFAGKSEIFALAVENFERSVTPMVSRQLISQELHGYTHLEITTKGQTVIAKKIDDHWKGVNKQLDNKTLQRLLIDLWAVKPQKTVSYLSSNQQLPETFLTIKIWQENENGDLAKDGLQMDFQAAPPETTGYWAELSKVPVIYLMPTRLVDDFMSLVASEQSQN